MRKIIFPVSGSRVHLAPNGELIQISTGDDSFAEHKMPEYNLTPWLCNAIRYEGDEPTDQDILECLRITKSELFQFTQGISANGKPDAMLAMSRRRPLSEYAVLSQLEYQADNVAAALHTGDFAIRVRTPELVKALAGFYEGIKAGHVVMAPGSKLGAYADGLVLVNTSLLTSDQLTQLARDVAGHLRRHRQIHW